jgi:hypothetical protein
MLAGVVKRWPWLLRLCLALAWVKLLVATRPGAGVGLTTLLALALTGVLLVLRYLGRGRVAVAGP